MPQAVDVASALERIAEQLRDLEHRVAILEAHSSSAAESADDSPVYLSEQPGVSGALRGYLPLELTTGVVPVLGKAVLAIAGAYLLRALSESGSLPKLPILFVAILYACFWMIWAVRTHKASRFSSVTYAVTSALILSPLLWESTVRFQVLSPALASAVMVAFVVLAIALAWKSDLQVIPWIATLAAILTSVALIIETRDLVPLTAALLIVALATEVAACLGHRLSLRAFPALAADFAVWLAIFILTSEPVPEGYRAVGPSTLGTLALAVLAIYGGSIGVRSFVQRQRITLFEIAQGVLAFGLAVFGITQVNHGSAAPAVGAFFLLLAGVCYWGALSRFLDEAYTRNRRVSATWAAALLLAGSFLLLAADFRVPFLSAAAVAAAFIYSRTRKYSLGLHTSFYLAAAAAVSPLPIYAGNAFAGAVPGAPALAVWIVVAAAALCYLIGAGVPEVRKRRWLWVLPALLVAFAAAALAVVAVVSLAGGRSELKASHLSVIRTVVACALALALGLLRVGWNRIELGWVAYIAVALGTLKLMVEDLRYGNAASLVVSLLFYGSVLILLPRLMRRTGKEPVSPGS